MVLANRERSSDTAGVEDRTHEASKRLPLSGVRVLVADDDRIPRRIASAAVVAAGGIPVEAADGPTALAVWSSKMSGPAFEAAVIDFVMPGMDGADLVQALRSLGFKGAAVGLTAAATDAQIDAWVAAGCDEVLPKGCSTGELVTELVAAHRRRQNGFRFKPR
jgi:CheY-like chemotaxis protein